MKPHKHAELIKAWADGAEIQISDGSGLWEDCMEFIAWNKDQEYRIKPEPNPDVVMYGVASFMGVAIGTTNIQKQANIKIIFDGETGKPKSAEVLK